MPVSRVFEICNAYESGVGHGVQRDEHTGEGIFNDSELTEAYKLGYGEGSQQAVKADAQGPCQFCEEIGPNALGGNYCFNCGRNLRTA